MSTQFSPLEEREKVRKQEWKKVHEEVDSFMDHLGYQIEAHIRPTVVALRVYGFPTTQSCEGHTIEGQGSSFPWVEIISEAPFGWEHDKEKEREWRSENTKLYKRVLDLLTMFYEHREVSYDIELSLKIVDKHGGFRLESSGAPVLRLLIRMDQLEKFELYRKEMSDFTVYLEHLFYE